MLNENYQNRRRRFKRVGLHYTVFARANRRHLPPTRKITRKILKSWAKCEGWAKTTVPAKNSAPNETGLEIRRRFFYFSLDSMFGVC